MTQGEATAVNWFDDRGEVARLYRRLEDRCEITLSEVADFIESPWRWELEYLAMTAPFTKEAAAALTRPAA